MTLGPKFFSCNKMAITRRTRHLRKRKALILEALVETHLSSYSKRDLKQFSTFRPWFLRLFKSKSFTFLVSLMIMLMIISLIINYLMLINIIIIIIIIIVINTITNISLSMLFNNVIFFFSGL